MNFKIFHKIFPRSKVNICPNTVPEKAHEREEDLYKEPLSETVSVSYSRDRLINPIFI